LIRDYNRQCLLVQTFCTNSVAANRTNFFILSKPCRTDDLSHFSYRTCAFCKARSRWQCAGITKIRLMLPRVKMSRADHNP
jgi:hypothetical protein